jgi:hypothetical protein
MNTKRATLADLQRPAPPTVPPMPSRPADSQTPDQQTTDVRSTGERKQQSTEVTPSRPLRQRRAPVAERARTLEVQTPALPKYLQLERKELLMWPEQVTRLSVQARTLNRIARERARSGGPAGERITVNTLIRVAVALLLSHAQDLAGATEEELRRSLGLPE